MKLKLEHKNTVDTGIIQVRSLLSFHGKLYLCFHDIPCMIPILHVSTQHTPTLSISYHYFLGTDDTDNGETPSFHSVQQGKRHSQLRFNKATTGVPNKF